MDVSLRFQTVLLLVAVAVFAPRAIAQSPRGLGDATADDARAAARTTATAGVRAMNEGRWSDAMALFARAEALVHAPPHLLYFARASAKLGKLVQANEAYLKILRETLAPTAPKAFVDAQAAAAAEQPAVEQRLPRLTIVVQGTRAHEAHVTVNGTEVPNALVGIAAPHDPGGLVLQAVAPGWKSDTAKVTLREGARETVKLVLSIPVAVATTSAPPPAPAPPAPKTGLRVAGWISVAIGVAGLGAGTYFVVDSQGNRDAASALCTLPNNLCPPAQRSTIEAHDSAAKTSAILAWVGYGVGGAAVVVGSVMLLLSRGRSEPAAAPKTGAVQPWFGPGSAGVSGTF